MTVSERVWSGPAGHAVSAVRRRIRAYRDHASLRRSDPRFERALQPALAIDGFTAPVELSLLYHLALHLEGAEPAVEIGSYLGRSTVVIGRAVADRGAGRVIAVDPHTGALGHGEPRATDQEFLRNIERAGVAEHVQMIKATSADAARNWCGEPIRMLFVDGWHSFDAVIDDVTGWAPFLTPSAAVVFDDYPDPGVHRAIRRLATDAVIGGTPIVVGKMIAFVPKRLVPLLPCPRGAATLGRLGELGHFIAYRLKPPSPIALPPP